MKLRAAQNDVVHAEGAYLLLLSIHGLVRGTDLELGRDADTGGQVKYVVELARALAAHPDVAKVELVTRLIDDERVGPTYASPLEALSDKASIVRIPCGSSRYLPKEQLWSHLDAFADNLLAYLRREGRVPDLIHGHYADAGYVATKLAAQLDLPMAFTGHSLGRVKRQRLIDSGVKPETIERRYRMSRRIEAEETALDHAAFVVASTQQEVEQQYLQYDHYVQQRMLVIPPGVDLSLFSPASSRRTGLWAAKAPIEKEVSRFLSDPAKPMILAIARPDAKKNLTGLIEAYAAHPTLRQTANLVVVAGGRDDINELEDGARHVLTQLLLLIDRHDLYGHVAYPKHHKPEDVPDLYRMAARTYGIFVNPALTEPFGLTLLEAAACGLPLVATNDGGPRDIIGNCRNGVLIDPLDTAALGEALHRAVTNRAQWRKWSQSGMRGVQKHYTWNAHVARYLKAVRTAVVPFDRRRRFYRSKNRLVTADRVLVCDIDNTLLGDRNGLERLLHLIAAVGDRVAFGIATGRSLDLALRALRQWKVPVPNLLITDVGAGLHYGPRLIEDRGWQQHINYRWRPDAVRAALADVTGLVLQPAENQGAFKVSYFWDPDGGPTPADIVSRLRQARLSAQVICSHGAYVDVLPVRASKGMAVRYFALKWGIPLDRCLVAGDSGNDEEMLVGNTLGVVVGNHDPELDHLRGDPRIYFADGECAWGILEGIEHYDFFGKIRSGASEVATYDAYAS
jgi:sucrose-phosphate synthase